MGGLMHAVELLHAGRGDFIIVERFDGFGGTTWRDVANETSKLQTEKGTYLVEYLNPDVHNEADMKTWPSRDSLLDMMCAAAEKHGLDDKAKFGTSVEQIKMIGNTLAGGHYELSLTTEDGSETLKASAVISCPGVFFNPVDIQWPGKQEFGGYITHGSYDNINYKKLKDASVMIVGHGGFTIENVRTCVEKQAKKIWVVGRHLHLSGPKMVSWMVSGAEIPIPGSVVVDAFQIMYDLVGVDVWKHPAVSAKGDRSTAVLTQSTTFGVTDIYFLARYYKVCEVIEGEVEKLSKGKAHLKSGQEVECDVIMKCLGSTGDPDFDDIIGLDHYCGWWANGDPLMPVVAPAKGVQAANFAGFSLAPGYISQVIANKFFIDYPDKFSEVKDWLPMQKRKADYQCNYIYTNSHVLTTMVLLSGKFPELAQKNADADKFKSVKHMASHPLDKHLSECEAEWKMYIKMMKDHGQITEEAPEVTYPYTKENVETLLQKGRSLIAAQYDRHEKVAAKGGK
eukprot:TRINITY_DN80600_c0_g1_i1.p1 TRINITY_DN80600_c0_g1~~TRINITY_DN80600_c0_g1_i1.p1  ORF type:complete len:557 (+),score=97.28 TRINITY_DN80600_c0_g1_i1:144-1673(+)